MKSLNQLPSVRLIILSLSLIASHLIASAQNKNDSLDAKLFNGPFMQLFQLDGCLCIYPTATTDEGGQQSGKNIFHKWTGYFINPEIISDSAAIETDVSNRNIFTVGNAETNFWIRKNEEQLLFSMTDTSISTDEIYYGENRVLALCQPNPHNPEKGWFFMSSPTTGSYQFDPGDSYFVLKDWSILDTTGIVTVNEFTKEGGNWKYSKSINKRDQARWIWYPGDFAIELNRRTSLMRKERNEIYPPLWTVQAPYGSVVFSKIITIPKTDTLSFYADGEFTITKGPLIRFHDFEPEKLVLEPGVYPIAANVVNYEGLPALLVQGRSVISDTSWRAHLGMRGEELVPGSWYLNDPGKPPARFQLSEKEIRPVSVVHGDTSVWADFGVETFGRLILENVEGEGEILVVYGESKEEAAAGKLAETWELLELTNESAQNDTLPVPMAFRYVNLIPGKDISIGNVSHLYEYLPIGKKSSFECNDEVLNEIFTASSRTLVLNTREVLFDGIKRDRWCWSGDVFIALPCAYYHYFDEAVIRRSLVALRGHDYVPHHINTIPDWTFYWFMNMYNHYFFTGDSLFIRNMYVKMKGMMDYCLDSRDERGFFKFNENDWPFTDWSDDIPYHDIQSFQQLLLLKSLEIMADFALLSDQKDDAENYSSIADSLKERIWNVFWKDEVNGFIHHEMDSGYIVNRYSNLYPILFGYLDEDQISGIKDHILINDTIPELGTPFHRTYEVAALCEAGEYRYAIEKMRTYWKGMLDLGATTFWERYDPDQTGLQHYTHSRRPFGRSLCHIWGAGPIYIFSRYISGLKPLEPGYKSYLIEPNLCGLEWFNTEMPVKGGWVRIYMDESRITIHSEIPGGICRFKSDRKPKINFGTASEIGNNLYEIVLDAGLEYSIRYY